MPNSKSMKDLKEQKFAYEFIFSRLALKSAYDRDTALEMKNAIMNQLGKNDFSSIDTTPEEFCEAFKAAAPDGAPMCSAKDAVSAFNTFHTMLDKNGKVLFSPYDDYFLNSVRSGVTPIEVDEILSINKNDVNWGERGRMLTNAKGVIYKTSVDDKGNIGKSRPVRYRMFKPLSLEFCNSIAETCSDAINMGIDLKNDNMVQNSSVYVSTGNFMNTLTDYMRNQDNSRLRNLDSVTHTELAEIINNVYSVYSKAGNVKLFKSAPDASDGIFNMQELYSDFQKRSRAQRQAIQALVQQPSAAQTQNVIDVERKLRNEYLFHDCIDRLNDEINKRNIEYKNKTPEDKDRDEKNNNQAGRRIPLIKNSKARYIRKVLGEKFNEAGLDFKSDDFEPDSDAVTIFNDVLRETIDVPEITGDVLTDADRNNAFNAFNDDVLVDNRESEMGTFKPLSPYDPDYSNLDAFRKNGSSLLYVNEDDLNKSTGEINKDNIVNVYKARTVKSITGADVVSISSKNRKRIYEAITPSDKSGVAKFRKFIKDGDYDELAEWVNRVGEDKFVDSSVSDRSLAMLEYLYSHGYTCDIKKGVKEGQLEAYVNDTKLRIRILDAKEEKFDKKTKTKTLTDNSIYVGSIYNTKTAMNTYFSYTGTNTPNQKGYVDINEMITPEDAVNMLKFSLGESINRYSFDGNSQSYVETNEPVGSITPEMQKRGDDAFLYSGTVTGSFDSGYVIYKPIKSNKSSSVMTDAKSNIRIYWTSTRTSSSSISFTDLNADVQNGNTSLSDDAKGAEEYIRQRIDSARDNFAAEVDFDGLECIVNNYFKSQDARAHIDAYNVFINAPSFKSLSEEERERLTKNYNEAIEFQKSENYVSEDYVPNLSSNEDIAALQRSYFDVMIGRETNLLKPGYTDDDFNDELGGHHSVDDKINYHDLYYYPDGTTGVDMVKDHLSGTLDRMFGSYEPTYYDGEQYSENAPNGKTFNPDNVARYMTSDGSVYSNQQTLIYAIKLAGLNVDEFRGDDYAVNQIKNRCIEFDESSSKNINDMINDYRNARDENGNPVSEQQAEFLQAICDSIKSSVEASGCQINDESGALDICMDENGIIKYNAKRHIGVKGKGMYYEDVEGTIGQVFIPDSDGLVTTKFAGGGNYMYAPGYRAYILPQADGENKSYMERTRLVGYTQEMCTAIKEQVHSDLVNYDSVNRKSENKKCIVGNTTNVNGVHRSVYGTRFALDEFDKFREQNTHNNIKDGMTDEEIAEVNEYTESIIRAIVRTSTRRIRYDNEIIEGAGMHEQYRSDKGITDYNDPTNDNFYNPYYSTDEHLIAIMGNESRGYVDFRATNNSKLQGGVRVLVDSAKVNVDGSITKGDENDNCALFNHPVYEYLAFMPVDRAFMNFTNAMTAQSIIKDVNVAQVTFGGHTFEDAIVVSKDWAEGHLVRGADGELRPFEAGDKLCPLDGNKGVISCVIDSDIDISDEAINSDPPSEFDKLCDKMAEANGYKNREQVRESLKKSIWFFKNNPKVDMVTSPYSAMSRYNGACTRRAIEYNEAHPDEQIDLNLWDGSVVKGGVATMSVIVTDMPVDIKSHNYVDPSEGRKLSSSMGSIICAADCVEALDSYYGTNANAFATTRELFIANGLDISDTGEILVGYKPHEGEHRRLFSMPELKYNMPTEKRAYQTKNPKGMRDDFEKIIDVSGGIMEIPFPLEYSGEVIVQKNGMGVTLPAIKTPVIVRQYYNPDTNITITDEEMKERQEQKLDVSGFTETCELISEEEADKRGLPKEGRTYGLQVMSSFMRSGQEFNDGTLSRHDYTKKYISIFDACNQYRFAAENKSGKTQMSEAQIAAEKEKHMKKAQAMLSGITSDIQARKFNDKKHNVFKDNLMAVKWNKSATAVLSPDPRLPIDCVKISRGAAESLGVKDGDPVLTMRDPAMHLTTVECMFVRIDDNIKGCSLNPAVVGRFDADHDGDSMGLFAIPDGAKRECLEKLAVRSNLLNRCTVEKDENGKLYHPLNFAAALDLGPAYALHPDLADERKEIEKEINELEYERKSDLTKAELTAERERLLRKLDDHFYKAFDDEYGTIAISYSSFEDHIKSYAKVGELGAKGNYKKLGTYCKYLGCEMELETDENGDVCKDANGDSIIKVEKKDNSLATMNDHIAVQTAVAIKTAGTGPAGAYNQVGIRAARDKCVELTLESTYFCTQGMLQAKHDPIEAAQLFDSIMNENCIKGLLSGYKLDCKSENGKNVMTIVRDSSGNPVRATREDFKTQFGQIFGPDGLGCSEFDPELIERMTGELSYTEVVDGKKVEYMYNLYDIDIPTACTLDNLAYAGKGFNLIREYASENKNIFDGKYSQHFAPTVVKENIDNKKHEIENIIDKYNKDKDNPKTISELCGVIKDEIDKFDKNFSDKNAEFESRIEKLCNDYDMLESSDKSADIISMYDAEAKNENKSVEDVIKDKITAVRQERVDLANSRRIYEHDYESLSRFNDNLASCAGLRVDYKHFVDRFKTSSPESKRALCNEFAAKYKVITRDNEPTEFDITKAIRDKGRAVKSEIEKLGNARIDKFITSNNKLVAQAVKSDDLISEQSEQKSNNKKAGKTIKSDINIRKEHKNAVKEQSDNKEFITANKKQVAEEVAEQKTKKSRLQQSTKNRGNEIPLSTVTNEKPNNDFDDDYQ